MPAPFRSLLLALAIGITPGLRGEAPSAAISPALANRSNDEKVHFFETFIRPTLVAECMECHGAEKQKGGLRLDSRPGWQKGGDSGAAILPGDPKGSLLLRSIQHLEPDLKMPDKAPKLDEAVISNFTLWIAMGAPDPRDSPPSAESAAGSKPPWKDLLAARRSWWSLQPLSNAQPPSRGEAGNASHPVDRFLNVPIAKAGLQPADPAPPEAIARRLHFLLTGLPPKPAELQSFVADCTKDRAQAVRLRTRALLASPAFGEHWARRWMDLVRYAESHGSEGDPEIPSAWQYRDYLIRAFNSDVPLDRLIREHLAGDLLPDPRISSEGINESRIGPAHLRMVEHGYQPVDTLDDQIKAVDNQIDVVTKAFLGLTVSCARCHDHKFDAISQNDYTALYGVFSSVRPTQLVADSDARLGLERKAAMRRLKDQLRLEYASIWQASVQELEGTLKTLLSPPVSESLAALQTELQKVDEEISQKGWAGLSEAGILRKTPAPYALWSFKFGANDLLGRVRSELLGGAQIKDGSLVLDGKGAFLQTSPLPVSFAERTFEAWLSPGDLDQGGGGVFGLEQISEHSFDSLVFAEKQRRKWVAGSNNFKRSLQSDGPEETSAAGESVHLAIAYSPDGTVALYRNGAPYGQPFRKDALHEYKAGDVRALIGLRHTGAGRGFFAGSIQEVRLYGRALSGAEIAASFAAGPLAAGTPVKSTTERAQSEADAAALKTLSEKAAALREEISRLSAPAESVSLQAEAAKAENPLHLAVKAVSLNAKDFGSFIRSYRQRMNLAISEAKAFNAANFTPGWDLSGEGSKAWWLDGPDAERVSCGDFRVQTSGSRAFESLLPAGIASSTLAPSLGGSASSPDFLLQSNSVSVRFAAQGGALLQVVADNYPLGNNSIFPRAVVERGKSAWTRLDSSYRVGSNAYLEVASPDHQPKRAAAPKAASKRSPQDAPAFLIEKVLFHAGNQPPREELPAVEWILAACSSEDPKEFLSEFRQCLKSAVSAWKDGQLTEEKRALLDACIETRVLSTELQASAGAQKIATAYRAETAKIPQPTLVPGVLEHRAKDAPFLTRGDHKKPGPPVPRRFLEVLDPTLYSAQTSGRDALAQNILAASNPLTSRVMANRIWHWIFGRGIVATVDNFGRMGEKPSNPELLDYLGRTLRDDAWSLKSFLELLVTSEAFQRSSVPSDAAGRIDPSNALLSHFSVRRLEAEPIRDSILAASNSLDSKMFGPPVPPGVPRRSVYLQQRRNNLPALLSVFDAPKPFTTAGRRDVTTVPAQSLTLLNDPALIQLSKAWANSIPKSPLDPAARVQEMFLTALGRRPSEHETSELVAFLNASGNDFGPLAHALINLKEFIYLR